MDQSCYVNRLDQNQCLLILTNIIVWKRKDQVDCMPNVRVETSFQINSDSLENIYNLFQQIKQALRKALFGGIFFQFSKQRMRLPSMESQQDHRKADEEKQAGLGDGRVFFCLFVCFYNFVPHKTILGGGGGHNPKTQGLSIYLAETIFFI